MIRSETARGHGGHTTRIFFPKRRQDLKKENSESSVKQRRELPGARVHEMKGKLDRRTPERPRRPPPRTPPRDSLRGKFARRVAVIIKQIGTSSRSLLAARLLPPPVYARTAWIVAGRDPSPTPITQCWTWNSYTAWRRVVWRRFHQVHANRLRIVCVTYIWSFLFHMDNVNYVGKFVYELCIISTQ